MENKIRRGRPLVEIKKTDNPEYAKNYYHLSNVRCDCECGLHYMKRNKFQHVKSMKHEFLMMKKKLEEQEL